MVRALLLTRWCLSSPECTLKPAQTPHLQIQAVGADHAGCSGLSTNQGREYVWQRLKPSTFQQFYHPNVCLLHSITPNQDVSAATNLQWSSPTDLILGRTLCKFKTILLGWVLWIVTALAVACVLILGLRTVSIGDGQQILLTDSDPRLSDILKV